ncbi:hypothetical protein ACJZ2D_004574 [Fusarium nematophilum]
MASAVRVRRYKTITRHVARLPAYPPSDVDTTLRIFRALAMGPATNIVPKAIRCNREAPCSNCVTSKITCQASPKDAARRAVNHPRDESGDSGLEVLQKRVAALEQLVKASSDSQVKAADSIALARHPSPCSVDLASLEGDSSFRKQTQLATDITEYVSLAGIGSPQVLDKLSGLRKLLEGKPNALKSPGWNQEQTPASLHAKMPPSEFVIRLLRAVQGPDCLLTIFFPIVDMEQAEELCRQALKAQTHGDLALQWRLSSTAARHCLALGYHREHVVASMPPGEANRVRRLFWHIYFSDKSLVLSLGRASTIQDVDVDIEPYQISDDPGRKPWDSSLFLFIDFAKMQTQIYETLYSPASRRHSRAEREIIVDALSKRLADWHQSWHDLDRSQAYQRSIFDCTFGPAEVTYYSTLTLLYRAVDLSGFSNNISEPCFEAAKKGLQGHVAVHAQYASSGPEAMALYAVWVHVYSSLTPFVVTFLHCISMPDVDDLRLLKSSLEILEQNSTIVDSCKRPYEFCKYLYGIAEAYISSCSDVDVGSIQGQGGAVLPVEHTFDANWFFPEGDILSFPSFLTSNWWAPHGGQK